MSNQKHPAHNIKTTFQTALELAFKRAFETNKCKHLAEFVITHPDGKTHKCIKCNEYYK